MGIQDFGTIGANASQKEIIDALADLQDTLNFLLNGGLDSLNIRKLTADKITTGILDAALVTIKSLLSAGAYIQIDGTGMKIFDGIKNTFIADITGLVTMTGALVRSTTGYPRVELNSPNNLIAAYADFDTYISFQPNYTSIPSLVLVDAGTTKAFLNRPSAVAGTTLGTFDSEPLNLQASGPLNLQPGGNLQINNVNGYTGFIDVVTSVTFGPTGGGTSVTKRITVNKGIITNFA